MATIQPYDTKAGRRYRVRYRTPNGRQTDKRGFTTKKAAEAWAAENTVAINTGTWVNPAYGAITVGTLGVEWLERQTHLTPAARKPVANAWRNRVEPRWGNTAISDIQPSEVQHWLSTMTALKGRTPDGEPRPLAATGVSYAHQVLSGILADAVRDRLIPSNPAEKMKLPRKKSKRKLYLDHQQLHRLADQMAQAGPGRDVLVLVLGYSGLRYGEATALRVASINEVRRRLIVTESATGTDGVIHVGETKGHKERTVPLPKTVFTQVVALAADRGSGDLLWPDPDGGHLGYPPYEGGWWLNAVARAELPHLTPHDLRHTAASLAVAAGANVKAVQRMLGHKSAAMTLDRYADLFDDDLDQVADRLDEHIARAELV